MKKTLLFFLLCTSMANAYQISSNHSYIKNSNFISDHYININGYGDFRGWYNKTENDLQTKKTEDVDTNFQTEISLDINIEKQLDEITNIGIHYIPTYNSLYKEPEKYFIYLDGYYGKFELGNTQGIFDLMKIGADTVALGTGGINGNFIRNVKLQNNAIYLLSPNSFLNQNFGLYNTETNQDHWNDTKYLPKINYVSPEFYGFQLGLTFVPNVKLKQDYAGYINLTNPIDLGHFVNYGINYINSFENVGVAFSIVGEQNLTSTLNKKDDVKQKIEYEFNSMEFGANINYFGWTIAGSVGRLDTNANKLSNSSALYNIIREKGEYQTYGLAYEFGDMLMSATFFNSEYKDFTTFDSLSVAIEKKMDKGYTIYGEYTKYNSSYKDGTTGLKTEYNGDFIYLGVMLNFE